MSNYRYFKPTADEIDSSKQNVINRDPLPDGDYYFFVLDVQEPYEKDDGKLVLRNKLQIDTPSRDWIWDQPWAGLDRNGKRHNKIGEFIRSIGAEPNEGEEPDWDAMIGKRGRCRLTIEEAKAGVMQGKMVNKVAFYHAPKVVGPTAKAEFPKPSAAAPAAKVTRFQDEDEEPDDVPFRSTIRKDVAKTNRRSFYV